jgi:hypothetical protein
MMKIGVTVEKHMRVGSSTIHVLNDMHMGSQCRQEAVTTHAVIRIQCDDQGRGAGEMQHGVPDELSPGHGLGAHVFQRRFQLVQQQNVVVRQWLVRYEQVRQRIELDDDPRREMSLRHRHFLVVHETQLPQSFVQLRCHGHARCGDQNTQIRILLQPAIKVVDDGLGFARALGRIDRRCAFVVSKQCPGLVCKAGIGGSGQQKRLVDAGSNDRIR